MATLTLLNLLGAAALLLWGLRMVRTGIVRIYGGELRRFLGFAARNRVVAFFSGLGVTLMLQSSTATAMLIGAFAARGMVDTAPALAVLLGADVGTSLVAQVLSFDLRWLSPLLILAGVATFMSSDATGRRNVGRIALGLGLMLLALRLLVESSEPLREAPALRVVLGSLEAEPFFAVLVAAILTWLAHSSLAMILLVATLAGTGVVPVPLAFALVLGINLGGAAVPLTAVLGEGPAARRVVVGNLIARAAGVAATLPALALVAPYLAAFESDPARQVVNFHTAFNLGTAVVFLLALGPVARLSRRLVPDAPVEKGQGQPQHLDRSALQTPAVALAAAARESLRMADLVEVMLRRTMTLLRESDTEGVAEVERMDDEVDTLNEAIKRYLMELSREPLDPAEGRRCAEILSFTTNLEHIGDIVDKSLMELAGKKAKLKLRFSDEGLKEIAALHARVIDNLQLAAGVFMSGDVALARRLVNDKATVRELERVATENHMERLREGRPESVETSALHLDVIRDLKRINSHIASVGYPILDARGELSTSRLRRPEPEEPGEDVAVEAAEKRRG